MCPVEQMFSYVNIFLHLHIYTSSKSLEINIQVLIHCLVSHLLSLLLPKYFELQHNVQNTLWMETMSFDRPYWHISDANMKLLQELFEENQDTGDCEAGFNGATAPPYGPPYNDKHCGGKLKQMGNAIQTWFVDLLVNGEIGLFISFSPFVLVDINYDSDWDQFPAPLSISV